MYNENLIDELKEEHKILLNMLNEVKRLKIISPEGLSKLNQSKETLLKHLQKEDNELYPVLKGKSQTNEAIQKVLTEFGDDMDAISSAALEFFEKYSKAFRLLLSLSIFINFLKS